MPPDRAEVDHALAYLGYTHNGKVSLETHRAFHDKRLAKQRTCAARAMTAGLTDVIETARRTRRESREHAACIATARSPEVVQDGNALYKALMGVNTDLDA